MYAIELVFTKCLCVPMPTHCTIMRFGFHARWIDGIKCGLFSNHAQLGQTTSLTHTNTDTHSLSLSLTQTQIPTNTLTHSHKHRYSHSLSHSLTPKLTNIGTCIIKKHEYVRLRNF